MPLKPCREYGKDVSTEAAVCPHCGAAAPPGMYRIYDPATFVRGVKEPLWGGMFGKSQEGSLSEFVARLPKLATALVGFVRVIRFYLAPFAGDARIRKRIEAALADHFYAQSGIVGQFQDEGIHYERTRQGEAPLVVNCHWYGHIRGAPETLELPRFGGG